MSSNIQDDLKRTPARRMQIFCGADARPVDDAHMPLVGIDDSVQAAFGQMAELEVGAGVGDRTVMLFADAGGSGLSLAYVWFKSGYTLPRHSHNADCLYYILAGEINMGTQVLKRGDGIFVPKNAPYTYQAGSEGVEVLEFRNESSFHFKFENNRTADWDKVLAAFRVGKKRWEGELPPSVQAGASEGFA